MGGLRYQLKSQTEIYGLGPPSDRGEVSQIRKRRKPTQDFPQEEKSSGPAQGAPSSNRAPITITVREGGGGVTERSLSKKGNVESIRWGGHAKCSPKVNVIVSSRRKKRGEQGWQVEMRSEARAYWASKSLP